MVTIINTQVNLWNSYSLLLFIITTATQVHLTLKLTMGHICWHRQSMSLFLYRMLKDSMLFTLVNVQLWLKLVGPEFRVKEIGGHLKMENWVTYHCEGRESSALLTGNNNILSCTRRMSWVCPDSCINTCISLCVYMCICGRGAAPSVHLQPCSS